MLQSKSHRRSGSTVLLRLFPLCYQERVNSREVLKEPPHVAASSGSVAYACREQVSGAEVVIPGPLDLAKPESIHRFVSHYRQQKYSCNILVNNAGAAYRREWYTDEGVAGLTQVCLNLNARTLTQFRIA